MRKATSKPLAMTPDELDSEMLARLRATAALPDNHINTVAPDASEVLDWSGAVRGRLYRPVKKLRSLRIDADVLAYFEAQGPGYQTRINRTLRASMLHGLRRQRQAARKKGQTA